MSARGRKRTTRKRKSTKARGRKSRATVTKKIGRYCDNRTIRNAINTASGYLYGHRGSREALEGAMRVLTSCDLSRNWGRRGGVTRSNATAALKYMALYEKKTRRRLRRYGGFKRKTVDAAKRYV